MPVEQDTAQPGGELALPVETAQGFPGLEERFLSQILRLGLVAAECKRLAQKLVFERLAYKAERLAVSSPGPGQQIQRVALHVCHRGHEQSSIQGTFWPADGPSM